MKLMKLNLVSGIYSYRINLTIRKSRHLRRHIIYDRSLHLGYKIGRRDCDEEMIKHNNT